MDSLNYVSRKINGVWDMDILDYAMEDNLNVLLMGDTGAGKTMLSAAYADKKRLEYVSVPCDVSIDPTVLFGKVAPTTDVGKFEWVDGPVTRIVRSGGVLNISEINYMSPKIAASLYPLLDKRRHIVLLNNHGEEVKAAENLLIVADMNPHYRGTMDINAAFANRFPIKLQWGYDPDVESRILDSQTLIEVAEQIRAMYMKELETPVSTNMLLDFERFAKSNLGLDFAISNFVSAFRSDERSSVYQYLSVNYDDLQREMEE